MIVTPIEALAARCGIVAEFTDARGELRRTSPETRRALLAAMNVAAEEGDAPDALRQMERMEWTRSLPKAVVLRTVGDDIGVPVTLPAGTQGVSWRMVLEDGAACKGEARFETLEFLERHELEGIGYERRRLVLGKALPWGYHRLRLGADDAEARVIVSPGTCWLPPRIEQGGRLWGIAAQLYLLKSATNWGIGDFGDLRKLVELVGGLGGDVVGVNPLHALFLDAPELASPYSPESRLLLNVLNIDVAALPELAQCAAALRRVESAAFAASLRRCRSAELVDYAGVAALKLPVLRQLFECCRAQPRAPRWREFETFRRNGAEVLERHCVFDALRQHFAAAGAAADWHQWPVDYRDPNSDAVARFAAEYADPVTFRAWLEFVADVQLGAAAAAAQPMAVGLYRDLAVGANRAGAETWANQVAVISDAQVGAPPDIYNPAGQDWGLPPLHPRALREEAYRSFIELLRANMRHAGGLRIDHVMALQQLYWVPKGRSPAEGAYVRYPLDELLGILALESQRHRCLVVGEDLGTVPAGFRERMAEAQVLSYRVLLFERNDGGFLMPDEYPSLALAVAGSHDLPTLRAWWQTSDLALKDQLHLFPSAADASRARTERRRDRAELLQAFRAVGLDVGEDMDTETLIHAAHTFLARSACALAMAQIDDLTDEVAPVNVPTTSDEHPNWRRRQSLSLEALATHPRLAAVAQLLRAERLRMRSRP